MFRAGHLATLLPASPLSTLASLSFSRSPRSSSTYSAHVLCPRNVSSLPARDARCLSPLPVQRSLARLVRHTHILSVSLPMYSTDSRIHRSVLRTRALCSIAAVHDTKVAARTCRPEGAAHTHTCELISPPSHAKLRARGDVPDRPHRHPPPDVSRPRPASAPPTSSRAN